MLHASSLTLPGRHPRLHPHNIGVEKIRGLERAGVSLGDAHLLMNSAGDSPLAAAVGLTTSVNGSRGTRHTITRVRAPRSTASQTWA